MVQFVNPNSPLPSSSYHMHQYARVRVNQIYVRLPSGSIPAIMARAVIERQVREQLDSLPD